MTEGQESLSPTIRSLDNNRRIENLPGAKFTSKKVLFGKEYDFYEDGSVLVVDSDQGEYHFLTSQGKTKGKHLRESAKGLVSGATNVEEMKLLGKGKGGFSQVYEMPTSKGVVAVKATDGAMFFFRELMEEATTKTTGKTPLEIMSEKGGGRKVVQRMSLKNTMQLLRKLDEQGIRTPEFYGFSVKRSTRPNEIQEFQFMEKIDRPTVESIMEAASDANLLNGGTVNPEKFPYADLLNQMAQRHYGGDQLRLMRAIVKSFTEFVAGVKQKVPNIADLEMDNIFLAGYDEQEGKPEFLFIDPIKEQVYIRSVRMSVRKLINDSSMFKITKQL